MAVNYARVASKVSSAAMALLNIAKDKVADTKKQEKINKGLTEKEVAAIRARGGRIVYHYRSNSIGDLLLDWYGRQYRKNLSTGVITRLIPKVNGKLAKRQRRELRQLEAHAA